ncbi:MAG: PAS domain S-box protein [Flavobacteriales bacterium]|nr:PAS domain S-box protein [Flavobacteriales bacterium]
MDVISTAEAIRYRMLLEHLPVGVLMIDNDVVTYANVSARKFTGGEVNGVVGRSVVDLIHPSYVDELFKLLGRAREWDVVEFKEMKLMNIDTGKVSDVEIGATGSKGGSVHLTIHDISSRKMLAREQLRAQIAEETNLQLQREIIERRKLMKELVNTEKFNKSIIDSSLDMIVATDIDYNINEFNKAAEHTFGYKRVEVLGKHISMLYSDRAEFAKVKTRIDSEGRVALDIVNRRKDKSLFISMLSASLLRNNDGEVIGAMGVSRDITTSRKAEEELRLSEERHRAIYDQAYIGIARIAKMGRFLLVNQRLSDMMGYTAEELYRKTFYELVLEKEVESSLQSWDDLLSGKLSNFSKEQTYVRSDGRHISANVTVSLVKDANEAPNYFVAVFEDVTERKENDRKLQDSLREKEVLLKEVHHRVKNNMQVISSILSLQSSYIDDEKALAMLRESQDRIKSMSFVHESLYQSDTLSEVNFAEYIRNIATNLYHSYGRPQGGIELIFDLEPVFINLDTSIPCGLIINELVSNALKYAFEGREKGRITIHLSRRSDKLLRMVVEDDGVGLPKDFDVETADSLGLQLVTALTTQVGGKLSIDISNGTKYVLDFNEQ